ncbi:MAG: TetR family transcriptional regulator [Sphingobium sp.]|nr:MAG: TetR family transcriptional regulator [Sphingobium sp.]
MLQIQAVALGILVEEGFPALTLREVARRCNIQIGAVSYYYKSRVDLFQDTISNVLKDYAENFRSIVQDKSKSDEDRLHSLIELLLDDMQSKQTTRLFPHLWMLANHDDLIAQTVDRIYILERNTLNMLIARINPKLSKQERETLSVFLSASIAGSTLFVGFEKPWARELPLYRAIASRALVETVKTITSEQLAAYGHNPQSSRPAWRAPTMLSDDEYEALLANDIVDLYDLDATSCPAGG